MKKWPLGISPLFNSLTKQTWENETQSLQDQANEMWVSIDALSKYPTMWWIPTQLMILCALVGISYSVRQGVDNILNNIDKSPQQEEVKNNTQANIKNVLMVDTLDVWYDAKDTLQTDVFEELQQFPIQAQQQFTTKK